MENRQRHIRCFENLWCDIIRSCSVYFEISRFTTHRPLPFAIEKAFFDAVNEGKPYDLEIELDSVKGNHKWIRTKGIPVMEEGRVILVQGSFQDISEMKKAEIKLKKLVNDLKKALAEINELRGYIPICANCKKVRDDEGYWQQVEQYISERTDAQFSHSLCPECTEKLYPGLNKKIEDQS